MAKGSRQSIARAKATCVDCAGGHVQVFAHSSRVPTDASRRHAPQLARTVVTLLHATPWFREFAATQAPPYDDSEAAPRCTGWGRAHIAKVDNNKPVVRVIVAEDNDDLRAVLPPLIEETSDLCCVATTASLGEVGPLIERHQAHVAVLDIELHGGSVLKLLPSLCKQFPATKFVIHSGHSNTEVIRRVHEAGAAAYVLKSGDLDDLIAAIRGAMAA